MSDNDRDQRIESQEQNPKVVELEITKAENFLDIYSNFARVQTGAYDVTLNFSATNPDEGTAPILARVRMSHAHAWVVAELILKQLKDLVHSQKQLFLVTESSLSNPVLRQAYEELKKEIDGSESDS